MSQFDKYIKIAQEMIFEGEKGKKTKSTMSAADVKSYFDDVIQNKEKFYLSMKKDEMSPHGGGIIYLSKAPLAKDNSDFKSMKADANHIDMQIKKVGIKKISKSNENIHPDMKEYAIVLKDAISFDEDDTEAKDFVLVV